MTKKLLLIGNGFTEVREYKLDPDKPRTDLKEGAVQFNLGFRRWPFWKYDVSKVELKQTDENIYKKADSPVSSDDYYIVEVMKSHENNGSLIIDEGKLSSLMGKTNKELVIEIERLNEENKMLMISNIERLKQSATDLKKMEEAFVGHAATYFRSATTNITELSRKISANVDQEEAEDRKKQQKEYQHEERARAYKGQPQLPETIPPTNSEITTEEEEEEKHSE